MLARTKERATVNQERVEKVREPGKPKRYGRTLRRLLLRRTDGINPRYADQLVRDGLVVVIGVDQTPCPAAGKGRDDRSSTRKNAVVRLTWRGCFYAILACFGWNRYGGDRGLTASDGIGRSGRE